MVQDQGRDVKTDVEVCKCDWDVCYSWIQQHMHEIHLTRQV